MMIREPLIFDISDTGKKAFSMPELDVPERKDLLKGIPFQEEIKGFPQVSELEIVRHFTRLSKTNYCIDEGFYPLGSCTMKYNPKVNEKVAALDGFTSSHPYAALDVNQGNLEVLKTTEKSSRGIGWDDVNSVLPGGQGRPAKDSSDP